jgi:predicted nuclease of restriction endonuclease-like RecB superfamily
VRFGLQDIKKQIYRRGGELHVGLHFLRPGELRPELERLIAYHEQLLGQPRRQFSIDDARACIGDYRLAHCLINTLSAWYRWQQPSWSDVLQSIGGNTQELLAEAGITSPVYLRLALYNYVNEHHHGFLDAQTRNEALQSFAAAKMYGQGLPLPCAPLPCAPESPNCAGSITPMQDAKGLPLPFQPLPSLPPIHNLEYLLSLDSNDEEILIRDTPRPPGVQDVATLYNQWAFESALFNASSVHFVIDCNAFELSNSGANLPTGAASRIATGIGTVVKRLCYMARLLGVYYDLNYEAPTSNSTALLHLTLYGPQEMTGAPQQYGVRLARLCRQLLGYGVSSRQKRNSTLTNAIVKAEATVHFLQRSYCFAMDQTLLSLLPPVEAASPGTSEQEEAPENVQQVAQGVPSVFDSSIEQSFAEAFIALENSQAVEGWKLIREPEPLILDGSIFIPDFALTRDQRRIYVEILGFWTPSYRERKVQKLQQLRERGDIVLAIPAEAREAFASIVQSFPITWYANQLSATELIKLLRSSYDDVAERLASIDVDAVRKRVQGAGFLTERVCYELLRAYRRSELLQAAERVSGQGVSFTAGIGLYQDNWMEQLRNSFVLLIESLGVPSLADLLHDARARWPSLAACEDATIEAILGLWPEVHVRRTSIFEATVEIVKDGAEHLYEVNNEEPADIMPAKKTLREKRPAPKKRVVKEAAQSDLWS